MIKKIFVRNYCGSDDFIDNFKSLSLVILSHCILPRDTVTERDLTKLNKSTDKKRNDLLTDNFCCFFNNKYIKNTSKCIYVLKRVNLNLIP